MSNRAVTSEDLVSVLTCLRMMSKVKHIIRHIRSVSMSTLQVLGFLHPSLNSGGLCLTALVAHIILRSVTLCQTFDCVFHFIRPEVISQPGDAIRRNRCLSSACWTSNIVQLPAGVVQILQTFLTERVIAMELIRSAPVD